MVERRRKSLVREYRRRFKRSIIKEIYRSLTRAVFANNDVYKPLLLDSRAQGVSAKSEQFSPNTKARCPMQLHRLKAGPAYALANMKYWTY